MRAAGKRKKKKSIFLRIALAAFSVYVVVMLIQLQLEISQRQRRIEEINAANEQLSKEIEDYLEEKARDSMARPGETIYYGN